MLAVFVSIACGHGSYGIAGRHAHLNLGLSDKALQMSGIVKQCSAVALRVARLPAQVHSLCRTTNPCFIVVAKQISQKIIHSRHPATSRGCTALMAT
jgi:hypothetical protein